MSSSFPVLHPTNLARQFSGSCAGRLGGSQIHKIPTGSTVSRPKPESEHLPDIVLYGRMHIGRSRATRAETAAANSAVEIAYSGGDLSLLKPK
jgi:hypothetical protein